MNELAGTQIDANMAHLLRRIAKKNQISRLKLSLGYGLAGGMKLCGGARKFLLIKSQVDLTNQTAAINSFGAGSAIAIGGAQPTLASLSQGGAVVDGCGLRLNY